MAPDQPTLSGHRAMPSFCCLTALVACGSGEGGNGANVTPPPSHPTMSSRAMPGTCVQATPETAISADQPTRVLISSSDLPIGATLTAAVGAERTTAIAATITALPADQWRAAMILPNPLPIGTCVLMMVTLADGDRGSLIPAYRRLGHGRNHAPQPMAQDLHDGGHRTSAKRQADTSRRSGQSVHPRGIPRRPQCPRQGRQVSCSPGAVPAMVRF